MPATPFRRRCEAGSAGAASRRRRTPGSIAFTLSCILVAAAPAHAQAVNYDDLEQLLGEAVTTSATGKLQRVSEVPANMVIITAEDIRRSGADNIPDILQFVAGLNVRRYGFAAADVGVRGYNETSNPRLLVLVNGQQVYLDDLGRTQWYTLPVQLGEIRQIEVIKGPSTALYGFNAASGVINIITYDPLYDTVDTATARVGTQDYKALSAVGTVPIAAIGAVRVSIDGFRASEFNPVTVYPDDLLYRSSPERGDVNIDGRLRIASGVELFASGAVVNTRVWEATASPYYGTDYQRTNWSRLGASADERFGLLGLSVYRNELRYSYDGFTEREDLHDTVYVVQASDVVKLASSQTIRFGLDYRNNIATSSDVLAGRVGYEVVSASAMWDWQITPGLSLTNAVRFDNFRLNQGGKLLPASGYTSSSYNDRAINQPSFNSGLVWKATEQDTFRLLAARGLQLPSIYDLGLQDVEVYHNQDQTDFFVGQPRLGATAISNVELDWDRSMPTILSTIRLAAFAQRTDDIISNPYEANPIDIGPLPNGTEGLIIPAADVGNSAARGGEVGLNGQAPSGLRWTASYSYISISDHLSINQDGIYSPQDYQNGAPAHVVVLGAGYTRGPWEMDLQGRWQSHFTDFRANPNGATLLPVTIGNYVVLNARLAYKVTRNATLALSALQFDNSQILEAAAPPVERRIFLSATVGF
nr:TonB-dependent receptor [uncultured Lichenicoccus sp.]